MVSSYQISPLHIPELRFEIVSKIISIQDQKCCRLVSKHFKSIIDYNAKKTLDHFNITTDQENAWQRYSSLIHIIKKLLTNNPDEIPYAEPDSLWLHTCHCEEDRFMMGTEFHAQYPHVTDKTLINHFVHFIQHSIITNPIKWSINARTWTISHVTDTMFYYHPARKDLRALWMIYSGSGSVKHGVDNKNLAVIKHYLKADEPTIPESLQTAAIKGDAESFNIIVSCIGKEKLSEYDLLENALEGGSIEILTLIGYFESEHAVKELKDLLCFTVKRGFADFKYVWDLIESKNPFSLSYSFRRKFMYWAAAGGSAEILEFLLSQDIHPHRMIDDVGYYPIHVAAFKGNIAFIEPLLFDVRACSIDVQDSVGNTPLFYAIMGGQPDVVQFLLEEGADANLPFVDIRFQLTLSLPISFTFGRFSITTALENALRSVYYHPKKFQRFGKIAKLLMFHSSIRIKINTLRNFSAWGRDLTYAETVESEIKTSIKNDLLCCFRRSSAKRRRRC